MQSRDYYQILGIDKDASRQQIREAYRKLALRYHPDRNHENPSAAEKMKEINESYAVLSDPQKRKQYDAFRTQFGSTAYSQFRQNYSEQDIFRGSDISQIFEEMSRAFGLRGFEDIFREAYGPGYRTFEFRRPGAYGRTFIYTRPRGYPQFGRGVPLGGNLGKFLKYGLKKMWGIELPEKGKDLFDTITISPERAQMGGKVLYTHRKSEKDFIVNLPEGIRSGQRIRLKGAGADGKGGGESGDLYVTVRVKKAFMKTIQDFLKNHLAKLHNWGAH